VLKAKAIASRDKGLKGQGKGGAGLRVDPMRVFSFNRRIVQGSLGVDTERVGSPHPQRFNGG